MWCVSIWFDNGDYKCHTNSTTHPAFRPVAVEINALLRGNKWRIWGEPFEIEMQSGEWLRDRLDVGFSHINMCLSGPSPSSGGGPQHQMEPSLV